MLWPEISMTVGALLCPLAGSPRARSLLNSDVESWLASKIVEVISKVWRLPT